jgi:hypothetical protein
MLRLFASLYSATQRMFPAILPHTHPPTPPHHTTPHTRAHTYTQVCFSDFQCYQMCTYTQLPGVVEALDMTDVLARGYWGSYNVPVFQDIYNMSGYPQLQSIIAHDADRAAALAEADPEEAVGTSTTARSAGNALTEKYSLPIRCAVLPCCVNCIIHRLKSSRLMSRWDGLPCALIFMLLLLFPHPFACSHANARTCTCTCTRSWLRYQTSPRASIFRRDQSAALDLDSFKVLIRYNNYKQDPVSCTAVEGGCFCCASGQQRRPWCV